ncbi:hypothetical protein COO60DRAFT_902093 [Scenedesmus sp. NREL 46B-D3]|nr:hypothetical protein COO60DRAFT_902093 [Scenedesmus sp. NREL 46B-D3]
MPRGAATFASCQLSMKVTATAPLAPHLQGAAACYRVIYIHEHMHSCMPSRVILQHRLIRVARRHVVHISMQQMYFSTDVAAMPTTTTPPPATTFDFTQQQYDQQTPVEMATVIQLEIAVHMCCTAQDVCLVRSSVTLQLTHCCSAIKCDIAASARNKRTCLATTASTAELPMLTHTMGRYRNTNSRFYSQMQIEPMQYAKALPHRKVYFSPLMQRKPQSYRTQINTMPNTHPHTHSSRHTRTLSSMPNHPSALRLLLQQHLKRMPACYRNTPTMTMPATRQEAPSSTLLQHSPRRPSARKAMLAD